MKKDSYGWSDTTELPQGRRPRLLVWDDATCTPKIVGYYDGSAKASQGWYEFGRATVKTFPTGKRITFRKFMLINVPEGIYETEYGQESMFHPFSVDDEGVSIPGTSPAKAKKAAAYLARKVW